MQIRQRLLAETYTPRTWRSHELHICPSDPYDPADPKNKKILDWIFLISALNFSFWSEKEGTPERYGVEWRRGWGQDERIVHTGYWSLVAALNRGTLYSTVIGKVMTDRRRTALEEGIPITDPTFYASEARCPDELIKHVFRQAEQSKESIPLLADRVRIMREMGFILTNVRRCHTNALPTTNTSTVFRRLLPTLSYRVPTTTPRRWYSS